MANRFCSILFVAGLMVCTISPVTFPQEQEASSAPQGAEVSKEQLRAIEQEIQNLRQQANKLAEQENSIISLLDQFGVQYQMKSHEIELLDLRQKKTRADIAALKQQFQDLNSSLEKQREHLSARLVEAYKLGRLNYLKLMLQAQSATDLLRTYQYVAFLARDDSRRLQLYRVSMKEKESMQMRLEQEDRNLAQLKQDLEQAHNDLVKSRMEKTRLLESVQTERSTHLSALNELKAAASQLQGFFVKQPQPEVDHLASGIEINRFKGSLDWPVRGKIIRTFGMQKHPRFGTTTMCNGVEIETVEGAPVTAIYDGKVMFAEWFKGYGKSIILSHPGGVYTLYAHNSELVVQRGDSVQKGQMIARAGSTGSLAGPSLYFEIREKDQPVNPLPWLRKLYSTGVR